MAKKVESDTFEPPCHKLSKDIKTKLEELLKEYKSQFAQKWNYHWHHTTDQDDERQWKFWTSFTKILINCNETLHMG